MISHSQTKLMLQIYFPQVILRDAGNPGECIYFIRSGQCQVVREMTLVRRTPPLAKRRLILPPLEAEGDNSHIFKIKSYDYVRKHFLVVCLFGKGDYFGVGEDFTKMSIISVNKVRKYMWVNVKIAASGDGAVLRRSKVL